MGIGLAFVDIGESVRFNLSNGGGPKRSPLSGPGSGGNFFQPSFKLAGNARDGARVQACQGGQRGEIHLGARCNAYPMAFESAEDEDFFGDGLEQGFAGGFRIGIPGYRDRARCGPVRLCLRLRRQLAPRGDRRGDSRRRSRHGVPRLRGRGSTLSAGGCRRAGRLQGLSRGDPRSGARGAPGMLDWYGGPFDPSGLDEARARFGMENMARRRRGPLASHRSGSRRPKR